MQNKHSLYAKELEDLIEAVRRTERARAARIVENEDIYSPYIVRQEAIRQNKARIAAKIRGEDE